jgi:hypothetical protein
MIDEDDKEKDVLAEGAVDEVLEETDEDEDDLVDVIDPLADDEKAWE